jgi:hypothetical protein
MSPIQANNRLQERVAARPYDESFSVCSLVDMGLTRVPPGHRMPEQWHIRGAVRFLDPLKRSVLDPS